MGMGRGREEIILLLPSKQVGLSAWWGGPRKQPAIRTPSLNPSDYPFAAEVKKVEVESLGGRKKEEETIVREKEGEKKGRRRKRKGTVGENVAATRRKAAGGDSEQEARPQRGPELRHHWLWRRRAGIADRPGR